jgi:hypothetical protein
MVFYWNTTRTYGVRWADFNGDGKPILAVGNMDGSAVTSGTNYLYTQHGNFVALVAFLSPFNTCAWPWATSTATKIMTSSPAQHPQRQCPVRLLRNNGAGVFCPATA